MVSHNHVLWNEEQWQRHTQPIIFKTYLAKPSSFLTEQSSLGNTSWVHAGESNSGIIVVSSVELRYGHHIANLNVERENLSIGTRHRSKAKQAKMLTYLRVLVCFGSEKWFAIRHLDRLLSSVFEAFQVWQYTPKIDRLMQIYYRPQA